MISAFFLAVGIVGMFASLCAVPLFHDSSVEAGAIVFVVSLAIASASMFGYRRARQRERTGNFRRSPSGIVFGVTLLVLGGLVASFTASESRKDLNANGPERIASIRGAIQDVAEGRRQTEEALAKHLQRKPTPPFPWDPQQERAVEMNLLRTIDEQTNRLDRFGRDLRDAEAVPLRMGLVFYGSYVFGLLCLALSLVSVFRKLRPTESISGSPSVPSSNISAQPPGQ